MNRKMKRYGNLGMNKLLAKVCTLLMSVIAMSVTFACNVQSRRARQETATAASPKLPQTIKRTSLPTPALLDYVQLLNRDHWLVGSFDEVWRTEDGGRTWIQSYGVKPDAGSGKHIGGLSFVDDKTGFLIVDRQFLRTDDGGISWNEVAELDFGAESCYFVDALHGWAVGAVEVEGFTQDPKTPQYVGVIFNTQDGGRTWQQQQADLPQGYFDEGTRWYLRDVFFSDQKTGWAVGFAVILWTDDGGENWHVADNPRGVYKGVRFLDNKFGWATEREGGEFSITTDGGRHWRLLDGPPVYGSWATNAVFLTPKHGYATLVKLYETQDGGQSWKSRSGSNEIGKGYDYIGRTRDGVLVALGLNEGNVTALVSTDNGTTWKPNK